MEIHRINANFWRVTWLKEGVVADFSKIKESHGTIMSEVRIYATIGERSGTDLVLCNLNLLSSIAKTKLAKDLHTKFNSVKWADMISESTIAVVDGYREGEPVEIVSSQDEVEEIKYKLWPFLFERQPTMFFGGGGSGKSFLALFMGIVVSLNWTNNPLGLIPIKGNVMYMDYEADKATIQRRIRGIAYDRPVKITYRRCALPLYDDIENIQKQVYEQKIDTIIVDSIGVACGGDLNAAETPNKFFGALRTLPVTSLLITHQSKTEEDKKSAFGSIYWSNLARSVWSVKSVQEIEKNETILGLRHTKVNDSKFEAPMAVKINFEKHVIFSKEDYNTIPEFVASLPLKVRIQSVLKKGMKSPKDIAEELSIKSNSVLITLRRLEAEGKVVRLDQDKRWALMHRAPPKSVPEGEPF